MEKTETKAEREARQAYLYWLTVLDTQEAEPEQRDAARYLLALEQAGSIQAMTANGGTPGEVIRQAGTAINTLFGVTR